MNSYARFGVGIMLSTLATLVGCQATCDDQKFFKTQDDRMSAGDQVSAYFSDVGKDFMDIFTLGVGAGKAGPLLFHANAHVTKYAELGYGQWAGWTSGLWSGSTTRLPSASTKDTMGVSAGRGGSNLP